VSTKAAGATEPTICRNGAVPSLCRPNSDRATLRREGQLAKLRWCCAASAAWAAGARAWAAAARAVHAMLDGTEARGRDDRAARPHPPGAHEQSFPVHRTGLSARTGMPATISPYILHTISM
jgi:hypothetical protein